MNADRPDTHEHEPRGAELVTTDGVALPLVSATLRAIARGGLARVVLEQTFENPRTETLHVTYKMPLPADGAVSGYAFTIGERTIEGTVEPKAKARETFEQAILEGRTAALLEQERADIFTQEIGNIPGGATIVARITVDQPLIWLPEGEWEFRFPTVIGPRYIGSAETEADARAVAVQVAKDGTAARIHLELEVGDALAPGRNVNSPSHELHDLRECVPRDSRGLVARDGVHELRAKEGARLDRDIVVRWPVARAEVGISLAAARPEARRPHANVAYGLLTIVPPAPDARLAAVPRDLIVLLDTSGSMGGAPLEQAKRVVSMLVDSLDTEDRLELIEFSNAPRRWKRSPEAATAAIKKDAKAWIGKLSAGGGTEMRTAVHEALTALRPGAQRQVVLVTDGYIGGEEQIVQLLHERLPTGCRMHFVGVGAAMNRSLATAIARAGRGAEVLVGFGDDVERTTKRLLDRTQRPVLTDVTVEGAAVVEVAPQHVPDVFACSPVVAAVKLATEGGDVIVRGKLAGGEVWERRIHASAIAAGEGNQGIVSLFGREHVADLEMRWTIGRETELIDRTIERVGVVFQIATRMTSWVAVDQVRSVDRANGDVRVVQPQEIPHGTTLANFGFGGSATLTGAPPRFDAAIRSRTAMAPPGAAAPAPAPMVMPSSQGMRAPMPEPTAMLARKRRLPVVPYLVIFLLLLVIATILWLIFR